MNRAIESSHPTFEQVDAVASAFEALASNERHTLDMGEANVIKHPCKTVACHGGWYLFHKLSQLEHSWTGHPADDGAYMNADIDVVDSITTRGDILPRDILPRERLPRPRAGSKDEEGSPDYCDGASAMAKDLGFRTTGAMTDHFARHPGVWGNRNARVMMHSRRAFVDDASDDELTLTHIATHWRGVADRIKWIEEERLREAL